MYVRSYVALKLILSNALRVIHTYVHRPKHADGMILYIRMCMYPVALTICVKE